MTNYAAEELCRQGVDALMNGEGNRALAFFEQAVAISRTPLYCSNLAYCLAKERGDFRQAITLCREAIKDEPRNSIHFLVLGRIHLMAGRKKEAIRIFRMGLRHQKNKDIIYELNSIGARKSPALPFLTRENPLNRYLGKLLKEIGWR
ncbi:MAG: tetratricopeptide repeat protein [Geobacteraceae bacterium]